MARVSAGRSRRFLVTLVTATIGASFIVAGPAPAAAAAPEPGPGLSSPDQAPAVTEKQAVDRAKRIKAPVEVLEQRTESSQTFARPNGTLTATQYLRPRWVNRGTNSWVDADATLRLAPDGTIRPVASTMDMTFSGGGTAPLATMRFNGNSLGLRWPEALPVPVIDGNTATYVNVLPDIDLRIVADVDSFTHLVIVKTAQAAKHPRLRQLDLRTELKGVTLRVQSGTGAVQATTGDGKVLFGGPTPTMWDSSDVAPATSGAAKQGPAVRRGRVAASEDVAVQAQAMPRAVLEPMTSRVTATVGNGKLTLLPDLAMLSNPGIKFPLYIDPTWSKFSDDQNNWTLLRYSFPTTSHWNRVEGAGTTSNAADENNHGIVRAGYSYDSVRTYRDRSLFNMNVSGVKYKTINKATFSLVQAWSWWNNCSMSNPPITDLRDVGGFNSGTTWNNQPGWGTTYASSAQIRKYGSGCGPQTVEFDVTGRVRELANAGADSVNLGLISRNDNGVEGNWTRFRLNTLALSIDYNTNPNAPTALTVAGKGCATGTARPYVTDNTPEFNASASDLDSGQQSLTTQYYWWRSTEQRGGDFVSATSANPGPVTPISIPGAKALLDATIYKFQAATVDDVGGITWSGVCEFRTSLNPPAQPAQIASTAYPVYNPANPGPGSGGVGISGTATITPPAAGQQDIVGFAYTLDSGVAPAAAPFVGAAGGVTATVTLIPKRPGVNTLRVWTKDVADRYSTEKIYEFKVRDGNGPAAEWHFTSASPGADDTGHGNTLTLAGSAAVNPGRANVSSALSLNGTTAYAGRAAALTQPHPDTGATLTVQTSSSFTVAAWMRLDTTGGTELRAAVSAPSVSSAFVLGYSGPDNKWIFQMSGSDINNAVKTFVLSDVTPVAGRWTQLVGTYDVSTKRLRLYVMGTEQAPSTTKTLSGNGFNAGQFEVGRYAWNGTRVGYFPGAVDDVRMYSYVAPMTVFADTLLPHAPTMTFPDGSSAVTGGTIAVRFDAQGDTNVTSFKYSTGTAALNLSATPNTPGGTATVNIPVSQAGELRIYGGTADIMNRLSLAVFVTATVAAQPKVSGVIYDSTDGLPVVGATVVLDGSGLSTTTGVGGAYTINGFGAGTYTLAAYVGGQCGKAAATVLVITQAVTQDLYLIPARDSFGHECVAEPGMPFDPAVGSTLALTGDDAVAAVSLPFTFPFYDGEYNTAWVDTNGIVTFTNPGGSHPAGERNIPAPAEPNNVVAAYWDDLVVDGSASVVTAVAGFEGFYEFVIEWRNVHLKGNTGARITVQLRLTQQGYILINYTGLDTAAEKGQNAVVGIESAGGEIGIQYSYRQSVLADNTMVAFTRPFIFDPIDTFEVSGVVTDADTGNPVAGLQVSLQPAELTTVTGPDGSYSFTDLEPGSYYVSAATAPFCGKYATIHVDLEGVADVDLELEPLADSFGNTCLAGPRSFAPATQLLDLEGDEDYTAISLPFPVGFYGQGYSTAWVDTNGVVSFLEPDGTSYEPSEIPSPAAPHVPNAAVYGFWDDLIIDEEAGVWTGLSGTAPNRQFAIEWRNADNYHYRGSRVSMQVVFHENGDISVAWNGIDPASSVEKGDGAVVGIENLGGTAALAYSMFQPVLASGQGVLFRPGTTIGTAGSVGGTVTCQGTAAANVVVSIAGQSATTAANGSYQITDIPIGTYSTVLTAASGACAGSTVSEAMIVGNETTILDVALAPIAGYTVVAGPRAFEPATTRMLLGGDDNLTGLSLPFPVALFGHSYTSGWVDTNGLVRFDLSDDGSAWDTTPIPSEYHDHRANTAVYAFWDDWYFGPESGVYTSVLGTAPNRKVVIEWRDVEMFGDSSRTVSFQVVFHENGQIAMAWDDLDDHFQEQGGEGVVGLENEDGSVALVYSQFSRSLRSGQGVLFQPAATPPLTGSLSGTATCNGTPASGVAVSVDGISTTTAANGTWSLAGLPVGPNTAIATKTGGSCPGSSLIEVDVVGGMTTTTPIGLWANAYTASTGALGFRPVTTELELSGDDSYTEVALPFPVTLYGQSYSTAWVDTNGLVTFVDPEHSAYNVSPIPSEPDSYQADAAVYGFWYDWCTDENSSIWTGVNGTGPNRTFTVEWRQMESFDQPDNDVSFQVTFHESGQISIAWDDLDVNFEEFGGWSVIGLENAAGTDAMVFGQFSPVLRSGRGVTFTPVP